ncbi:MAG: flagellar protein FlgN [Desulfobacterales bacterium]|nr:flagellar protein FlgN [Desulfobacterales bacterium]
MELTALLERQASLYGRMVSILRREKAAAMAASPAVLEEIRLEKEPLLDALAAEERQRAALVDRIARSMGLDPDAVNVTALARVLGGLAGERLDACRQSLTRRLETVGRLNREVGDLVACGLRLVQGTMALIGPLTQPGRIYHRSGRFSPGRGSGRIVSGNI